MKILLDFLPVVAFFVAFKLSADDMFAATGAAIIASVLVVAWTWWREGRVEKMAIASAGLMVVLGGITLLLHDDTFVLWKPTAVNWLFALVFLGSQWIGGQPLVQRMLGQQLELPDALWRRLNFAWIAFFAFSGAASLYVAFHYDRETWVNFKLFGMLGLTVLFVLGQGLWLARHVKQPDT